MAKAIKALKKQTFRIVNPDAERVLLVGDFTQWQTGPIPMKKDNNGVWTATVSLAPGTYNYLFIVDGQWCEDPECPARVPNPYGGENMVRQVV